MDIEDEEVSLCPMSTAKPQDPVLAPLFRLRDLLRSLERIHLGEVEERQAELAGAPVRKPTDHDGRPLPRVSTAHLGTQLQLTHRALTRALYSSEKELQRTRPGRAHFSEIESELTRLAWIESLEGTIAPRDPLEVRLEKARNTRASELTVSGAGLSQVPMAVWSIASLRELDVSRNTLPAIPPDVSRLRRLRVLVLDGNTLAQLPPRAVLEQLEHLEVLRAAGNALSELPEAVLSALPALRELDLSDNRIAEIPAEAVAAAPALESLSLAGNAIAEVPLEIAESATLRSLDVSRCALTAIPEELLRGPEVLRDIAFAGNESLVSPPREVADQGRSAVLRWYKVKAQEEEEAANNRSSDEEDSEEESYDD